MRHLAEAKSAVYGIEATRWALCSELVQVTATQPERHSSATIIGGEIIGYGTVSVEYCRTGTCSHVEPHFWVVCLDAPHSKHFANKPQHVINASRKSCIADNRRECL